jgi:ribonuclease III
MADDALTIIECRLGYSFRRRELVGEALRHRSAAHERGLPSNERLEFLGDAALSHVIAALLYSRWPRASEGELTRARAALVRERTLAVLARDLGIEEALDLGTGLRESRASAGLLADSLEAVLGALLLDGGWRSFRRVVRRLWGARLAALDPTQLALEEPKSALQELAQRRGRRLPVYSEVEVRGPAHGRVYVFEVSLEGSVLARGQGSTKREAQQEAARKALEVLAESADDE